MAAAVAGRAVLLTLNPEFGRIIAVSLRMNLIETLIADFSGSGLAQSRLELTTRARCGRVVRSRDRTDRRHARTRRPRRGIG